MDSVGAADYNLNVIASKIKQITDSEKYRGLPLIPMRYGGDEFVVAIAGKCTPEAQLQFDECLNEVREAIRKINWHSKSATHQINFTEELLHCPLGGIEQELIDTYLDCGTLLGRKDIDQILKDFTVDGALDEQGLRAELSRVKRKPVPYPNDVITNIQKLEHFQIKFPSFAPALEEVIKANAQAKVDFFVDFIERIVYDPLLGYDVKKFNILLNEIEEGKQFREVVFIEGRFLKEFNKISFLKGDIHKLNTWEVIKNAIPDELLAQITIVNRGASFMIGIPEGMSDQERGLLQNKIAVLDQVPAKSSGRETRLPIGTASCSADRILPPSTYTEEGHVESAGSQSMGITFHKGIMETIFTKAKMIVREEANTETHKKSYKDIVKGLIAEYLFIDMRKVAEKNCDEQQAELLDTYSDNEIRALLDTDSSQFDLQKGIDPVQNHDPIRNYIFWLYYHEPKRLADRVQRTIDKMRNPTKKQIFQ